MTTTRKHWLWFWCAWTAWLIASVAISRSGDIEVSFPADSPLPLAQRQKAIAVASLWDAGLADNGLSGSSAVVKFVVRVEPTVGLASTPVHYYLVNSRGTRTVDGSQPIAISLNSNAAPLLWDINYFGFVLFHEMGHALGFAEEQWFMNGYVTGSMMFVGGVFTFVSDNRYVGSALATYQAYRDPLAQWIPMDGSHYAEPSPSDPWYNEIMTVGISSSQWTSTFLSPVTWAVCSDNGWTLNPAPPTGPLLSLIPARRLRGEDLP